MTGGEVSMSARTLLVTLFFGFLVPLGTCYGQSGLPQNYPSKPIRLIVPWPPGGGTDVIGRAIAQKLSERLKTSIVVDNRAGASGNIGTEIAAHSPNDGYTLLLATSSLAYNPSMFKKLPYDPIRDFVPITLVGSVPHLIVVSPSFPVRTVQELIAYARDKPGQVNYASAGNGTNFHLAAELFRNMSDIRWTHVPYRGGGPAVMATISGEVNVTFANVVAVLPQIQAGKLRALAITSASRFATLPDVPTVSEA